MDSNHLGFASLAIHADHGISAHRALAPALHTTTIFRYSDDADQLQAMSNLDPLAPRDSHLYSRLTNPNTTRLEAVLSALLRGRAVTYSSGLAAFHALLVRLAPRRLFIGPEGYQGCFGVARLVSRLSGMEILPLEAFWAEGDAAEAAVPRPGQGDLVHIETPVNPTGEARDIAAYASRAHAAGSWLSVDSTLGPPPLQDPFALGADVVMHSGTKYLGGHSDLLCGVLAVSAERSDWAEGLFQDRQYLGAVMGNLEGWLGLRSVRTLELRVERQSRSAQALVDWLVAETRQLPDGPAGRVVERVSYASLQESACPPWLRRQMPRGFGPVFSIIARNERYARRLPSKLALFAHATSLGGVESIVEWRAMTDQTADRCLLRVSVGIEAVEDLMEDLRQGFGQLVEEGSAPMGGPAV